MITITIMRLSVLKSSMIAFSKSDDNSKFNEYLSSLLPVNIEKRVWQSYSFRLRVCRQRQRRSWTANFVEDRYWLHISYFTTIWNFFRSKRIYLLLIYKYLLSNDNKFMEKHFCVDVSYFIFLLMIVIFSYFIFHIFVHARHIFIFHISYFCSCSSYFIFHIIFLLTFKMTYIFIFHIWS